MGRDSTIKFIGLDVHSKNISVAIADEGRKGEVRYYETIKNTTEFIDKVIKSLKATLALYVQVCSGNGNRSLNSCFALHGRNYQLLMPYL